jgi:hypothetical protein
MTPEDENEIDVAGPEEVETPPVEDNFPETMPETKKSLTFMERKRRHLLILLGGRAPHP